MLVDLLCRFRPVFSEEQADYHDLCRELSVEHAFIGLMPAISLDFWPIYALGCTHASRFTKSNSIPKIYFMPLAVADCAVYPALISAVREFYTADPPRAPEIKKEKENLLTRLFGKHKDPTPEKKEPDCKYGIEIDEVIPLVTRVTGTSHPIRISPECEFNAIYFRLVLPNKNHVHLFGFCDTPEGVWKSALEDFEIRADMMIHSSKGMGHWFTSTPLYEHLCETKKPHLLPSYYFRGKQITRNDAPLGSQEAEIIEDDSFGGVSRIYRLPERFEL